MINRHPQCPSLRVRRRRPRGGFTLLELLVTLGIILVLISILIPTVKKMREKAQEAAVKAQISSLDSAIARYQQDFNAFPGPLPRAALYPETTGQNGTTAILDKATNAAMSNISGSENLVLGLMGGLVPVGTTIQFDKDVVGRGPRGLNTANPKAYQPYIDGMILSQGNYTDGAGTAIDSAIPEILDRFSNPMPILYLRAQVGARGVVSNEGNAPGTTPVFTPLAPTQYDIREILSYTDDTKGSIGEGKDISEDDYKNVPGVSGTVRPHGLQTVDPSRTMDKTDATNYAYPYDAFPYISNPTIPPTDASTAAAKNATGTPRNKDRYILISAGVDRVYGTPDDITNAGSVIE